MFYLFINYSIGGGGLFTIEFVLRHLQILSIKAKLCVGPYLPYHLGYLSTHLITYTIKAKLKVKDEFLPNPQVTNIYFSKG